MPKVILRWVLLALLCGGTALAQQQPPPMPTPMGSVVSVEYPPLDAEKRLITFGGGVIFLQDVPAVLADAQNTAFDGLVLDIETPRDHRGLGWSLFTNQPVDQAQLDGLAAQFNGFAWGRLTDNFLRVNIYPGAVDWFEDFSTVLYNLEAVSRLAAQLGFRGIMLDTEQYGDTSLFYFGERPGFYTSTQEQYAAQAFMRGQEVMQALNRGYPGMTVIYTFGISYVAQWQPPNQFALNPYELLTPFINGMIAAADANTVLVDGYEQSYTYTTELQFTDAYNFVRNLVPGMHAPDPARYRQVLRMGFGLWIDAWCDGSGLRAEPCPGGFTPQSFSAALRFAWRYSDRYVWVYSQGINWFTSAGIPPEWQPAVAAMGQLP